jgi:hypothetical protein
MLRDGLFSLFLVLVTATSAAAQRDALLAEPKVPAEWGISFSFLPSWDFNPTLLSTLAGVEPEHITGADGHKTFDGSTWSIGFARGRALGAEWGISFTQQRIRKGSLMNRVYTYDCLPGVQCSDGDRLTYTDVTVIGPEVHFYIPFATYKERIQIGMVLGGGVGAFRGTGVEERVESNCCATTPITPIVTRTEGDITQITEQIYFGEPYTFYGRAEPGVAVLVSERVRLFAGAGFHYPGSTYFSVRASYFFPRAAP